METISSSLFHDAPIDRISTSVDAMQIDVEEFAISETQTCPPTRIYFENVRKITRNGIEVPALIPELVDGEIYDITIQDSGIEVILIWHSYKPSSSDLVVYFLSDADVRVAVL